LVMETTMTPSFFRWCQRAKEVTTILSTILQKLMFVLWIV